MLNKKIILTLLLTLALSPVCYCTIISIINCFNANPTSNFTKNQNFSSFEHVVAASAKTSDARAEKDLPGSRERLDGKEYIKINLAELSDMCERNDTDRISDRYVMRGYVLEIPELEKEVRVALLRKTNWCCAAHMFAYGFKIPANRQDIPESGRWVKLYGKLRETGESELDEKITIDKLPVYIMKKWILMPEKIEAIETPSGPEIKNWCTKEPFTY